MSESLRPTHWEELALMQAEINELRAALVERVPLSDEAVEDLRGDANRGFNIEREDYFKAFRDAEKVHNIKER